MQPSTAAARLRELLPAGRAAILRLGGLLLGLLSAIPGARAEVVLTDNQARIVAAARESVARAPSHDPAYVPLAYPGGDPGWERGASADVVVRALRAIGIDLQVYVYSDALQRSTAYGLAEPDPNILHRRVRNLETYLSHRATSLGVGPTADWQPGDIVVWSLSGNDRPNHGGVLTDRMSPRGYPLVVHHLPLYGPFSGRPEEADVLFRWQVVGHYRIEAAEPRQSSDDPAAVEEGPSDAPTVEPQPSLVAEPSRVAEASPPPVAHGVEGRPVQSVELGDLLADEVAPIEVEESAVEAVAEAPDLPPAVPPATDLPPAPDVPAMLALLAGARDSITRAPRYDTAYVAGGDPGSGRGASVDLVWRAYASAGFDLPAELAADVAADPSIYGIRQPDPSIDHRRLRNLARYFERHATVLSAERGADWRPGDLVLWNVRGGTRPTHIGIVSDQRSASGEPLVVHHLPASVLGAGVPAESDVLFRWRLVGHYRMGVETGGPATAAAAALALAPAESEDAPLASAEAMAPPPGSPAAAVLAANVEGDILGRAVASGDFNGDGVADLAVGAPGKPAPSGPTSGRVMVFRGGPDGLEPWTDLWPGELDAGGHAQEFGWTLAALDADGDGRDDLAVGAPGSEPDVEKPGWVFLFRGSTSGLVPWRRLDQQGLDRETAGDDFGWAVAGGDFDGDGFGDLAVGAPGEAVAGEPGAGRVFLFRGSPQGLAAWAEIGQAGLEVDEADDRFGWSLAVGDITGDGRDELAVGAPGEGLGFRPRSGAVFLFLGTEVEPSPWQVVGQLGLGRNEEGDEFGWSVAVGDFNGDRAADLAVGAPGEAFGSVPQSGWVFAFLGSDEGALPWMSVGQDALGLVNEPQDRFGWSLVAADFDGDLSADLAVGVPGDGEGGSVLLFRGSRTDLNGWQALSASGLGALAPVAEMGRSVAAADLDGDGLDDLVIGADSEPNLGSVLLFRGSRSALEAWLARGRTEWLAVQGAEPGTAGEHLGSNRP